MMKKKDKIADVGNSPVRLEADTRRKKIFIVAAVLLGAWFSFWVVAFLIGHGLRKQEIFAQALRSALDNIEFKTDFENYRNHHYREDEGWYYKLSAESEPFMFDWVLYAYECDSSEYSSNDCRDAFEFVSRAVNEGGYHPWFVDMLAFMYEKGIGTAKDLRKAKSLYKTTSGGKSQFSKERLKRLGD
jgi:TPR repeat protein